jgi:hypothetical protein
VFVLFRYADDDNFYRFIMDRERSFRRLEKKTGGTYTTLAEDLTAGYGSDWHTVHIAMTGELISVSINYAPVFAVEDHSLNAGQIGLGTWGSTDCYFDNVLVTTADADPYADAVADAIIKLSGNAHADPTQALGGPNGTVTEGYVSVGGPGYWLLVDMGEGEEIIDGPGDDFRVYEIGAIFGGVDEEYDVFGGNSSAGPWTYVGQGWTTSVFDLEGSGLSSARYILIDDLSTRTSDGSCPGSDIDAIQALNMTGGMTIEAPGSVGYTTSGNDVLLNWMPVDRAVGYNVYASHLGGGIGFNLLEFLTNPIVWGSENVLATSLISYTHYGAADEGLIYAITSVSAEGWESSFSLEVPFSQRVFLPLIKKD